MRKKIALSIMVFLILFAVLNTSFLYANEDVQQDLENEEVPVEEEQEPETPAEEVVQVESDGVPVEETKATIKTYALQSHEVIVNSYAELKSQVENRTNGKTTFYFGANITQTDTPIIIQWEKQQLIIDGTNPDTGIRHTYTERAQGNRAITLEGKNPNNAYIKMQNMNIYGQNENGTVQFDDNVNAATLHYSNVYFDGPQLVYNRKQTTILEDMDILVRSAGYAYPSEEIGEVLTLIFRGNNTINHNPGTNKAVVFFNFAGGSTTVDPGASVNITTTGFYNSIYASNNAFNNLSFYGRENSSFTLTQSGINDYVMKGTNGNFELNNGANFTLKRAAGSSSTPVFDWESSTSNLNLNGANFELSSTATLAPILKVGKINAVNSNILVHAREDSSSYLASIGTTSVSYPVRIEGGSFKMQVDGNSTASNSQGGLFQRGAWEMINSELSMHAKGDIGNYIFNMSDPKFTGTKINTVVDGTVTGQTTASFMDTYTIILDNSEINMRANVNSGRMLAASTGFATINASKIRLYTERLDGNTQMLSVPNDIDVSSGGELSVISNQSNNGGRLVELNGSILVNEGATFKVVSNGGTSIPALIHFKGENRVFSVNKPKAFVMFARGTSASFLTTTSTVNFAFSGKQINQWKTAETYPSAGTLDNLPDFEYVKKDGSNFSMNGALNISAGLLSFTTNHTAEDGDQPDGNFGFQMSAARIISIGDMQLTQEEATQNDTILRGISEPYARIRIHYTSRGTSYVADGQADETGVYAITVNPISAEDIDVEANIDFLYKRTSKSVVSSGELRFESVPAIMPFGEAGIPTQLTFFDRLDPDWMIRVSDDRSSTSNWELLATISKELTPTDESKPKIENAFVFFDEQGKKVQLGNEPVVIAQSKDGPILTDVIWGSGRGIMLAIDPGSVYINTEYSGTIRWTLQDAP